jgi:death on curing protein
LPNKALRWIQKKGLILLHGESLARFGGPAGIRDEGLLESALARPPSLHAYKPDSSVAELAAAYAYGLIKNHPFMDGNKRAGFLSIGLFLAINGHELTADQVDAIQTILAVAGGGINEQALAQWIARNSAAR